MSTITADDNEAYIKTRNTTKLYCQVGDETKKVFVKKAENFIPMLTSLIIHMKENMFRLSTSFRQNKVIVRPKASP